LAVGKPLPKAGVGRKKANPIKNATVDKKPWDKDTERSPKERIFLSIDAIDSTKFKSSFGEQDNTPGVWAKDFATFLSVVAVVYQKKLIEVIKKYCPDDCPNKHEHGTQELSPHMVNVWKYIGDEVVLMAELTCTRHHASLHVLALAETIKQFNNYFAKISEENPNKMRFKGTAWVAGFPVRNIEINLPGPEGQEVKDFLGPSMDLGFRLSKFASDDRLIVSASLAYFIANEPPRKKPFKLWDKNDHLRLPLCFGGLAEVKGVRGNKHPLIWYSVNETAESKLSFVQNDALLSYLENSPFINKEIPPFILGTGNVSQKYMVSYNKAVKEQKEIPGSPFYPKGKQINSATKEGVATTSELDALFEDISSKLAK
jgi:hypothetical protein